jgi:glycerate 2-kinase
MTLASDARAIARAGIDAVRPGPAVRGALRIRQGALWIRGERYALSRGGSIALVAIGKAAGAMADAAFRVLGPRVEGIVVVPEQGHAPQAPFPVFRGGHPLPDARSVRAARAVTEFIDDRTRDPILFLLSGGGSAICESPAGGISLGSLRKTSRILLASGAPIQAMNVVRRHLSSIKGGQLGARLEGRHATSLAVSDVVGDTPWDIASGPTVADPTTFGEAREAARRFGFWDRLPIEVRVRIERGVRGKVPEDVKPGDPRLRGHRFVLIASNRDALDGAANAARTRGYRSTILSSSVVGETQEAARAHVAMLRASLEHGRPGDPPACLLSGGETTVTLGDAPGRGGRNQEFALAAAEGLEGLRGSLVLSVGTDGVDGTTDVAGGWVDDRTASRARRLHIDLARALSRHQSYDALSRLHRLWKTGPTGTNVMDLHVLLAKRR